MKLNNKTIAICFTDDKYVFYKEKLLTQIKETTNMKLFSIFDNFDMQHDKRDYRIIKMLQKFKFEEIAYTKNKAKELGERKILDIIFIISCNENDISKLANNIFETPTMEIVKYHLINNKPVVLGICANNALSNNAENIGKLLNMKNIYFVPFKQTNPITKPYLLCYDERYTLKTLENAINKIQIQPIIVSL